MNKLRQICSGLILAAAITSGARAADPVPQAIGWIAVPSIDRINQAITDLQLPIPPHVEGFIEQLPFLGPGSIDTARPIGFIYLGSDQATIDRAGMGVIPVNAGKATVEQFTRQAHGVVDADHPDTVSIGGRAFLRRTADYLIFSAGSPDAAEALKQIPFVGPKPAPELLMSADFDVAAAKLAMPARYAAFFHDMRTRGEPARTAAGDQARLASQNAVADALEKITHLKFALNHRDSNLELVTEIQPTPVGPMGRSFAAPELPADALVTAHIVYPDHNSSLWPAKALDGLLLQSGVDPALFDAFHSIGENILTGDAQSIAIQMIDNAPVFTLVNQSDDESPVADRVRAMFEKIGDQSPADKASFSDIAGLPPGCTGFVARFGMPVYTLAVMRQGKTVTYVLSQKLQASYAPVRLAQKARISHLLVARLEADAVFALADKTDENWKAMPAEQQKPLRDLLAHTALTLDVTSQDKPDPALKIVLTAPTNLIQAAPLLMQLSNTRSGWSNGPGQR